MEVIFHKTFLKQYKKLPKKDQLRFDKQLEAFTKNPTDYSLRNHPLGGDMAGYWSIDIRSDLRAQYYLASQDIAMFTNIGTHSQLYN